MKIEAFAFTFALATAACMVSAQVHTEAGDASGLAGGQLTGSGTLSAIEGVLDSTDADMYSIRVDDWSVFSASTMDVTGLPSPIVGDTQLFLFNAMGIAIATNDDSHINFLSMLEVGSAIYSGRTAGELVWIAVSGSGTRPQAGGLDIFTDLTPSGHANPATGPGAAGAVDGWAGANYGGSYRITLTGASAVPAPGALALLGVGGLAIGRRRRN